jgi:hypothetical protein
MKEKLLLKILFWTTILSASENIPTDPLYIGKITDYGMGGRICRYTAPIGSNLEFSIQIPYQLKTLSSRTLTLETKTGNSTWSGTLAQSGDDIFRQTLVSAGAGKRLNKKNWLGVSLNVIKQNSPVDEGYLLFAGIEGFSRISSSTTLSFLVLNPNGAKLKTRNEKLTIGSSAHTGIEVEAGKAFRTSAEIGLRTDQKPQLSLGINWGNPNTICLQAGLGTQSLQPTWGLSANKGKWQCKYGGKWHSILGVSSSVSLTYQWKKP